MQLAIVNLDKCNPSRTILHLKIYNSTPANMHFWTFNHTILHLLATSSPSLFGIPLVVSCTSTTSCQALYRMVWEQVSRGNTGTC